LLELSQIVTHEVAGKKMVTYKRTSTECKERKVVMEYLSFSLFAIPPESVCLGEIHTLHFNPAH